MKLNKSAQMVVVLVGVIVVATAVLQGANLVTAAIVARNENLKLYHGALSVMGLAADRDVEARFRQVFEPLDLKPQAPLRAAFVARQDGQVLGYVVRLTGGGFQGTIDIVVGFTAALDRTTGMEVITTGETPGLGGEMNTCNPRYCFKQQFYDGVATEPQVAFIKYRAPGKPNQFEAITGATFTSTAIRDFLNKALTQLRAAVAGES